MEAHYLIIIIIKHLFLDILVTITFLLQKALGQNIGGTVTIVALFPLLLFCRILDERCEAR